MKKPLWIRLFAWLAWPVLAGALASAYYVGIGHREPVYALLTVFLLLAFPVMLVIWVVLSIWWKMTVSRSLAEAAANRSSPPGNGAVRPAAPPQSHGG